MAAVTRRLLAPACACLLAASHCALAAGPSAEAVQKALGVRSGLVVHVGATEGSLAEVLVRAEPLLVHAVAAGSASEARLRQRFVQAGVHGQVTAGSLTAGGALPLADDVVALVVADGHVFTHGFPYLRGAGIRPRATVAASISRKAATRVRNCSVSARL